MLPHAEREDYDMRFDILTLFPPIFDGYLGQSLLKKGIAAHGSTVKAYLAGSAIGFYGNSGEQLENY